MAFHKLAVKSFLLTATVAAAFTTTQAFVPSIASSRTGISSRWSATSTATRHYYNGLKMVATTPADLGMNVDNDGNVLGGSLSNGGGGAGGGKNDDQGTMMDLKGIVFSVSY